MVRHQAGLNRPAQLDGAGISDALLLRTGHMTRALHENQRGLGLDSLVF